LPKSGGKGSGEGSLIGAGMTVQGSLQAHEDLVVHGRLSGQVQITGSLTIAADGELNGEVTATSISISGKATGNLVATERFELLAGGRMDGDTNSPIIVLHDGGKYVGGINLGERFKDARR
jgi:cytoskeletal protein CcmA (bactofilin family)